MSICLLALAPVVSTAPAFASSSESMVLRDVLRELLETSLIPGSIQCGARIGDGVPDYADVKAFMAQATVFAQKGTAPLRDFLHKAIASDHAEGRIMVIDGWVLMHTEALAASAFVILEDRDCRIAKQT